MDVAHLRPLRGIKSRTGPGRVDRWRARTDAFVSSTAARMNLKGPAIAMPCPMFAGVVDLVPDRTTDDVVGPTHTELWVAHAFGHGQHCSCPPCTCPARDY